MKKTLLVLAILAMLAMAAGTAAADAGFLGKPAEDFTATDTEGNAFTLSAALKDHEAALINLWATWCGPCRNEMPYLQQLWENYGDRVAVIALSTDPDDTTEKIAAFRKDYGLTFPMGRDEGQVLSARYNAQAIPDTLIVDRFGNAVFYHTGMFMNYEELERTVKTFLGDGYTESRVLAEIPKDSSTRAFPVSAKRGVYAENEGAKKIVFHFDEEGEGNPLTGYIVPEGKARIRLEITAADDPGETMCYDLWGGYSLLTELLDPERGAFVTEQDAAGGDGEDAWHFGYGNLQYSDPESGETGVLEWFLFSGEAYIEEAVQALAEVNLHNITWEYAEDEAKAAPQAYVIHVADQNGGPVAAAAVNFCTDTSCTPAVSDENGVITFDGAPDKYHVQLIALPEGYSSDEGFEMYTEAGYGEWILRVKKD